MSLTPLFASCAAALLLSAAPLAAQQAAQRDSAAPRRDSVVTRPLSAADREKFVGDYDILLPNGWIMATLVFVQDDQLMVQPEGDQKLPLRYLGNETFALDVDPTLRLVFEVKDGKVLGGKLTQRGQRNERVSSSMTIDGAFRRRVLAREFLSGFWLNLGSAVTAEMAGLAGFDWVMLDHEHGPGSETTILHQLQAVAATPATCLVRIAANEPPRFKRVLDAGAHGVMVPYVSTAAEARAAVQSMRYPAAWYARRGEAHARVVVRRAIRRVLRARARVARHARADRDRRRSRERGGDRRGGRCRRRVRRADGSDDEHGHSGQYGDARFHDALGEVADAAQSAGKAAGILLLDPANLPLVRELGYTVVALGSDGGSVAAGLKQSLVTLRTGS
jgi:4-hydroxy-2-oxoheptanedioate aldolase